MSFFRGTTPYHYFDVPFKREDVESLSIAYAQEDELIIEKTLDDVSIEDKQVELINLDTGEKETVNGAEITVHLTQTDTLRFEGDSKVEVQLRAIVNGEAVAWDIIKTTASRILRDGELQ